MNRSRRLRVDARVDAEFSETVVAAAAAAGGDRGRRAVLALGRGDGGDYNNSHRHNKSRHNNTFRHGADLGIV